MSNNRKNPVNPIIELFPGEKPTLKTISRISGLAVPTVSRALNDAPDIGAESKKLVRRIATEIGYVPNRAGVRLRTGRTNVISLVLSTEHDMMNHTARLISAIASGLQNTSFHMNITPYFPPDDPMTPIRYVVETGSADAVILNQVQPDDPRVAYLMERKFPFATHGRSQWADQHAYFDFDNAAFGEIAMRGLAERGRKHIYVVPPPPDQNYGKELIKGMERAARDLGLRLHVAQGVTSDSGTTIIQREVARILGADSSIDGTVAASASGSMAAVAGLESTGRVLGVDIDLVAKEAVPFLKLFRSEILVVEEDVRRAGAFLAKASIQAIKHPNEPPLQELEVPRFVI